MSDPCQNASDNELRLQTVCLLALTLLAAGVTLWLLRPVLVPFVLALFFVIGLSPLLDFIQRRLNVGRPAAIGVSFLLGVFLVFSFGILLGNTIATINTHKEEYIESIGGIMVGAAERLEVWGIDLFNEDPTVTASGKNDQPPADNEASQKQAIDQIGMLVSAQAKDGLLWLAGVLLNLMVSLGVVLIFVFFLLAGASSEARPTTGLWAEIEGKIRGYIITKTIISLFTGLAFGGVLALFSVPFPIELGVLAFLLNFVPNVGPVIASVLPVPIVLVMVPEDVPLWWRALALAAGAAVQIISGNVIEPKVMGDSFELHPIVILLSLILWGMIWGPVGVLLAVPMTAAVKVLLEKLDRTRPVAALLAGHLAPIEAVVDRGGVA